MFSVTATHSRIRNLMSSKVGAEAAELEFRIWVIRLWISVLSLVTFLCIVLAIRLASWSFGGFAIAGYIGMLLLFARTFVLRHRFYLAASSALGFRVSLRHPPRGVPNWRRPLNKGQLERLDVMYESWYEARRLENLDP
jgi:hypothetical protein